MPILLKNIDAVDVIAPAADKMALYLENLTFYTKNSANEIERLNDSSKEQTLVQTTGTITIDASIYSNFYIELTQNLLLANPINLFNGKFLNICFKQHPSTPYNVTFGNMFTFAGGTVPVLTQTAGAVDFMACYYNTANNKLRCVMNKGFA